MRPSRFPAFLFGVIIGLLIVPAAVYCYFRFGFAPVATGAAAMPFEKRFARMGLRARMDKEYPRNAPIQGNDGNYMAGAHRYAQALAGCHGAPGEAGEPRGTRAYPAPPHAV